MALISLSGYSQPKRRPAAYKARDAAYQTGGNAGYYIAARPRPYPMTAQQKKVKNAADTCGIKAGIKKSDLQIKMKECVGPAMRK
ncbi:MAG: hypothetical protein ACYDHZ_00780 [Dehalococcoidia bacterium]